MNKWLLPLVAVGVLGIGIIVGYLIFNNNPQPVYPENSNVEKASTVVIENEEKMALPEQPKPVKKPKKDRVNPKVDSYTEYDGWDNGDDVVYDFSYPGDKVYVYGVKNGEWFAKNTRTNKTFNINRDPKYRPTTDKLDELYPYAKMP
jgi:hypothetical protein